MKPSTSRHKKKAAAALAATAALAFAGAPFLLLDGPGAEGGPPEPPWSFPAVAAQRLDGDAWSSTTDLVRPTALMYVDEACVYCKAELRTWESLVQEAADVEFWIVASPSSDVRQTSWVPTALRGNVLSDTDGSVARALNATVVPITFWIDSTDTVRFVHVGRGTRRRVAETMQSIARTSLQAGAPVQ